jgi:hypothetical protein
MNTNLTFIGCCGLFLGFGTGCETATVNALDIKSSTVDIRSVSPTPPNVVIALDESGSMEEPATLNGVTDPCSSNNPVCCTETGSYGSWCPATQGGTCANPCKWDDMLNAMTDATSGFLVEAAGKAQFGFVGFPTDGECGAPTQLDIPIGSSNTSQIAAKILGSQPGGGTPTAAVLQMIGAVPGFVVPGSNSYVLMVTDGLPNCNPNNAQLCAGCNNNPSTCMCPVNPDGTSNCCNPTTAANCGNGVLNQCLDSGAAVAAISSLLQNGIKTIVVGFGAEAQLGVAGTVLDAMAQAGGEAGICGGPTAYCEAEDSIQLQTALGTIHAQLRQAGACVYTLSHQPDPQTLIVQLFESGSSTPNETLTSGTGYTLSGNVVTILGQACALLEASQPGEWTVKFTYS